MVSALNQSEAPACPHAPLSDLQRLYDYFPLSLSRSGQFDSNSLRKYLLECVFVQRREVIYAKRNKGRPVEKVEAEKYIYQASVK